MKKIIFFLLGFSKVFADEPVPNAPSLISDIGNMMMTMIFLLAIVFGILFFLKKITNRRIKYLNHSTAIKILERRVLGPKSSLFLVDILGKAVVISESQGNIQLITEFPAGTDVQALLEEETSHEEPSSMQKFFSKIFNK